MQSKVNIFVSSIGEIHQEQVHVARVLKESTSVRDADLERMAAKGCYAVSPTAATQPRVHVRRGEHGQPPPVDPGKIPHTPQKNSSSD